MFDRRSKFLSTVTLLQDLAVTDVAFAAAYVLRTFLVQFEFFTRHLPGIYPFSHYVPLMLCVPARRGRWWATAPGSIETWRCRTPYQLVLNLLNQLAIVLVDHLRRTLPFPSHRRQPHLRPAGRGGRLPLLLVGRYVSYNGIAWMRKRLKRYHYFVVVGSGSRARRMATLIEESRGMGLRLVGFVDPTARARRSETDSATTRSFPPAPNGARPTGPGALTRSYSPSTCRS